MLFRSPDDETIGTGGAMAKAAEAGHRVVLVTGTRGELGEIVVPDMDTPDNHRRLGEIRAGDPAWYPGQFEEPGLEPWAPSKLYIQAIPASVRERMNATMLERGMKPFWAPPDDATPEQIAEFEEYAAKIRGHLA